MHKKDIFKGLIIGVLVTALGTGLFTIFLGFKLNLTFAEMIDQGFSNKLLGKRASIGAILNLPIFYFFLSKKKDNVAKGILMSLLIVAFIFIISLF